MENAVGRIDHLQRKMPMTARNLVGKKAWAANLHSDIKQAATQDPTKEFKIRHIVLPTDEIYGDDKAKRRQYKNQPFISLYVDCDHQCILGEGGLPVFNYVVPRWRTLGGFPQGFSPATITALPDGRMLQSLARIILEQGEKAVDPPVVAKGEIFRDAVNLYAGGFTYADLENDEKLQDVLQVLSNGGNLSVGMEMKADVRNLIAEAFLLNKLTFPMLDGMPILQVQALLEESKRNLLPFFGPVESEYHLPLLDTAFQMAVRNNQFDFQEMPEALQDADVTFVFESPLSSREGRQTLASFQESIQVLAASAEFDETIPSLMNIKTMTKDAIKGTGAKADWFNDEETQQSEEDAANSVQRLKAMATALQGGAAVGADVANATIAMQQAGIA